MAQTSLWSSESGTRVQNSSAAGSAVLLSCHVPTVTPLAKHHGAKTHFDTASRHRLHVPRRCVRVLYLGTHHDSATSSYAEHVGAWRVTRLRRDLAWLPLVIMPSVLDSASKNKIVIFSDTENVNYKTCKLANRVAQRFNLPSMQHNEFLTFNNCLASASDFVEMPDTAARFDFTYTGMLSCYLFIVFCPIFF